MSISRFVKAIAYEILTALLLIISALFQAAMHTEGQMEKAYFQSNTFLFIAAATFLGVGVYSLVSYTRRHRQHILDSVFFLIVGLLLMAAVLVAILLYGGLEGTFDASGYTAVNLNLILLTLLPALFFVRSVILAFSTREGLAKRLGVQLGLLVLAAAAVVLLATGRLMRLAEYTEPPAGGDSQPGYTILEE